MSRRGAAVALQNRQVRTRAFGSLVLGMISAAASGCGIAPLPVGDRDMPQSDPHVSGRSTIATEVPPRDLAMVAADTTVVVRWTDGERRRTAMSTDEGRSFTPDEQVLPLSTVAADAPVPFGFSRVGHATWRVTPSAAAYRRDTWSIEVDADVDDAPVATQEFCGAVAVVSIESSDRGAHLVLRRYLPPRGPADAFGQALALPVTLSDVTALRGPVVVRSVLDAAILAWADGQDVNIARVELPDVICSRPRT